MNNRGATLDRIAKAKRAGVKRPILLGGSVTADNVAEALATADGAIVSTSLMRKDAAPGDLLLWDADKSRAFMDRALAALPA